jgi:hypothetical protein
VQHQSAAGAGHICAARPSEPQPQHAHGAIVRSVAERRAHLSLHMDVGTVESPHHSHTCTHIQTHANAHTHSHTRTHAHTCSGRSRASKHASPSDGRDDSWTAHSSSSAAARSTPVSASDPADVPEQMHAHDHENTQGIITSTHMVTHKLAQEYRTHT